MGSGSGPAQAVIDGMEDGKVERVHLRTQVRRLVAKAVEEIPDGEKFIPVVQCRPRPLQSEELPVINVFIASDVTSDGTGRIQGRRIKNRTFTVRVVPFVSDNVVDGVELEDKIEFIAGEIEDRLNKWFSVGSEKQDIVRRMSLNDVTTILLARGGETVCATSMSFSATVSHLEGDSFHALGQE